MAESSHTFQLLVHEHQAQVVRVCRSILRDEHLGADAAQEAFARLWRQLKTGATPVQAGAWLRRVAVRAALDLQRRQSAHTAAIERATEETTTSEPQSPDARASREEMRRAFEKAVARLPEGQRSIFLLRHEGGLRLSEVAETLDLALPTVKTQFARACLKLASHLRSFVSEEDVRS